MSFCRLQFMFSNLTSVFSRPVKFAAANSVAEVERKDRPWVKIQPETLSNWVVLREQCFISIIFFGKTLSKLKKKNNHRIQNTLVCQLHSRCGCIALGKHVFNHRGIRYIQFHTSQLQRHTLIHARRSLLDGALDLRFYR